jgi:hypothetical protein
LISANAQVLHIIRYYSSDASTSNDSCAAESLPF